MEKIYLVTEHSIGEGYDDVRNFAYSTKTKALDKMQALIDAAKEDMGIDANTIGHFEICDNADSWECYDNCSYDEMRIDLTMLVVDED